MSSTRLTETSYIVLGLLEQGEPATPYDLKRFAQLSTNNFWSVPHTQLYTECARLASEGLLDERQEQSGRRRRTYRLTASGRQSAGGVAQRAGERALRTARRGHAEAVLRRRSGGARHLTARCAQAQAAGVPAAERGRGGAAAGPAPGARVRDRPRARVHPLLVARGQGRLIRRGHRGPRPRRGVLSRTGPRRADAAARRRRDRPRR